MPATTVNWSPDQLRDDLVSLIPLKATDFELLYKVASDPLVWEQHPIQDRYKRDVFQLFFDAAIQSATAFLIQEQNTKQVIGSTRFYDYKPGESSVAIGYTFLARPYWGGLYNRAVKKLMMDYAFGFVDKICFHIGAANLRSQKAIAKLGAEKFRELDFDHYGKPLLHYEYVIYKNNYKVN